MRVFITGASGWIGSASVDELLAGGHEVVGLARSDASATALEAKGARVLRGDLDDLDALRRGAAAADAVVHLANKHDWTDPAGTDRAERAAVQAIGDELAGSGRAFALASGLARFGLGRPVEETDRSPADGPDALRGGSENLALGFAERGVRAVALRFAPTVHGAGDHGFVAVLAAVARQRGVSAWIGDGENAWSAVHRSDAARLVRLAVEGVPAGSRLHVVAEERITTRAIAEALGRALDLPARSIPAADAAEHFGFLGGFFGADVAASSARTRRGTGWTPTGPTLLEDVAAGAYPGA